MILKYYLYKNAFCSKIIIMLLLLMNFRLFKYNYNFVVLKQRENLILIKSIKIKIEKLLKKENYLKNMNKIDNI